MTDGQAKPGLLAMIPASEIALEHSASEANVWELLDAGAKEEMGEHTEDYDTALAIASHHIYKYGLGYYPALAEMEAQLKRGKIL